MIPANLPENVRRILAASRADMIPEAAAGPWFVRKYQCSQPLQAPRGEKGVVTIPPGRYTQLFRFTLSTMHLPLPDLVMQDTPDELETHLNFMLRARGRVLITGLGLGCVARGCLASSAVDHVTVIERDSDVLELVGAYLYHLPRLTIVHADAWVKKNRQSFDCAWHDLWSDPDKDEPALAVIHGKLLVTLKRRVPLQGAWAFPKQFKRALGVSV